MSNEIIKASGAPAVKTMDDLERLSKLFASSGLFKDTRDAAQCGIRILAGLELGFGAFTSMSGVHIIQGKPTYSANLIAATVKRSGRYTYRVKEHTDEICHLTFHERDGARWEDIGTSVFTLDDAKKANLLNNPTWRNYPRNMLFSRALTNGVRWHCPDVFGFAVYSPDEMGAEVDGDGNVLQAQVTEPKALEAQPVKEKPNQVAIGPKRAEALANEIKKLGVDVSDEKAVIEGVFGPCEIHKLEDLTDGEGFQLLKRLQKQAKEAAKEPWETWQDDNAAITYGAAAANEHGIFRGGGSAIMHAWEEHKNFTDDANLYRTWQERIQNLIAEAKQAA